MPEQVEGDRILVNGPSRACFFPRLEQESHFIREFDGRTAAGAYALDGSVYGRNLAFRGSGVSNGVVVSRGDMHIDVARPGERATFLGSVSANGGLVVDAPDCALQESAIGDVRRASVLVRGDVVGDQVRLRNAAIVGNVHGTNIQLTNCIVFGSVIASERILAQGSTLMYYHCRGMTFEGPCMMLQAMGESSSMPVFAPYEDAAGGLFPADVRYYPAARAEGAGGLGNRPWERDPSARTSRLVPHADWVAVDTASGNPATAGSTASSKRFVLTIAGRALNLAALQVFTDRMAGMLRTAFEFDHYDRRNQSAALERLREEGTDEEAWLFCNLLKPKEQSNAQS